ncbi:hypothetical protein OUZ56_017664 [Daphnia magna]|uniref:Uncharacterized protein n=1 Tax=Daphnia magna TaxID=35525 RepID=A0ABR0ATE3_9CRUS|nr:hypothetical protein OUZ56_017664 [Daphnia magna]
MEYAFFHNFRNDDELLLKGFTGPLVLDENIYCYGALVGQATVAYIEKSFEESTTNEAFACSTVY